MFVVFLSIAANAEDDEWAPPESAKAGWDWARLDTSEWVKGEMVVMHDDVMRFDSDKFDEIDVDWEDIDDLRLARPRVFRRKGRRTYAGMGELRDGVIRILTADGEQVEFPKGELVSIVSIVYTGEQELRNWRLRIGANLTTRAGNTDEQDISATAQIHRYTPFNRWTSSYSGTFSRVRRGSDGQQPPRLERARLSRYASIFHSSSELRVLLGRVPEHRRSLHPGRQPRLRRDRQLHCRLATHDRRCRPGHEL